MGPVVFIDKIVDYKIYFKDLHRTVMEIQRL
jgi:hypothetical protein